MSDHISVEPLTPGGVEEVRRHPASRAELALVATIDDLRQEVRKLQAVQRRSDPCDECDADTDDWCRMCPVLNGIEPLVRMRARIRQLEDSDVGLSNKVVELERRIKMFTPDVSKINHLEAECCRLDGELKAANRDALRWRERAESANHYVRGVDDR